MKMGNTLPQRLARVVLLAAVILALLIVAMQFTDQMVWTRFDFAAAGALLIGTGLLYALATTRAGNGAYRAAVAVALGAALTLVWLNLAVGVIGTEDDRANLMYVGVLAVGGVGAVIARLRPRGMAHALFATALAQAVAGAIALTLRLGDPWSPPAELLLLNGVFVALFTGSGWLFRQAARQPSSELASSGGNR
ncbi:MAG TPA: hypothetical protein VMY76_10780 [Gemmatimonadales bacterium]|nr:hypothetical protein [Gemmatimonadales bacterium]